MIEVKHRKPTRRLPPRTICGAATQKKIDYPGAGNSSLFLFDGLGRNRQIIETIASAISSTKQMVWCGTTNCEERNAGSSITKKFFELGEIISTSSFFATRDHLNSIRELTDLSGIIQAQYSFDAFGRRRVFLETVTSDFQYAGYYFHLRSNLFGTNTRAYSAHIGRFINRDTIQERGGVNMYFYASNSPILYSDPEGTVPGGSNSGGGGGGGGGGSSLNEKKMDINSIAFCWIYILLDIK